MNIGAILFEYNLSGILLSRGNTSVLASIKYLSTLRQLFYSIRVWECNRDSVDQTNILI